MNHFYVYGHYTVDTNELFYIGKGKGGRLNDKSGRNKLWHRIVSSHGFRAEKMIEDLEESEAFFQEILGIAEFKPRANFTAGGYGGYTGPNKGNWKKGHKPWNTGRKCPDISERQRGKNSPMFGKPHVSRRPVICTTDGIRFACVTDACKHYGIERSNIISALTGKTDTADRKCFEYTDVALREKANERRAKRLREYDKGAKIICVETREVFCSIQECARKLNLHAGNIHKVLTGLRNRTGGKTFKRVE